ncbi:PREDICTED: uncharacterized protein LOC107350927 isoform X2 [Acropora digitifera]|uniref:uncharacterized protein LOC107350927 isoform X2 n=1 Tax=Acropora digitifera TaxID=70779 RepID=UPI00077AA999|nr:PREDICTED: uncharacterized protein LOC107350927 isoform X2 [Acropora digitifera]
MPFICQLFRQEKNQRPLHPKKDKQHTSQRLLETEDVLRFRISRLQECVGELGAIFREEQSEFAGRRKRIKSESRSGILDKRQEKAMEKTITKLCLLLAMLHLVGMADGVSIASKVHSSKQPVITYFGLHNATGIAFIGNNINLTCTMENADLGTFLKSVPYPSGVSAQSNNTRLSAQ